MANDVSGALEGPASALFMLGSPCSRWWCTHKWLQRKDGIEKQQRQSWAEALHRDAGATTTVHPCCTLQAMMVWVTLPPKQTSPKADLSIGIGINIGIHIHTAASIVVNEGLHMLELACSTARCATDTPYWLVRAESECCRSLRMSVYFGAQTGTNVGG